MRASMTLHLIGLVVVATSCASVESAEHADVPSTTIADSMTTAAATTAAPTTAASAATSSAPIQTSETSGPGTTEPVVAPEVMAVRTGAGVLVDTNFDVLEGRRVGLIANQTSRVDGAHLIDLLHDAPHVDLRAVFAPEHGVRGTADAGELVDDHVDRRTDTPIFSLYGSTRQPTPEMLEGIDVLVYDLQDVGARYYTFISTMGLAMQAAAEAGIDVIILDRPNPSGRRTSGFVRTEDQESFVGLYPLPAMYGLTAGELATLIVEQAWLPGLSGLDLTVVEMTGWRPEGGWDETGLGWVPPSPGLPAPRNAISYPAFVLLEATSASYGSGTLDVFTIVGAPWADAALLTAELNERALPGVRFERIEFVPEVIPDVSVRPRFEGERVFGSRLVITDAAAFDAVATGVHVIEVLLAHSEGRLAEGEMLISRPAAFDRLAGTTRLRTLLEAGVPAAGIVDEWAAEVAAFESLAARVHRY